MEYSQLLGKSITGGMNSIGNHKDIILWYHLSFVFDLLSIQYLLEIIISSSSIVLLLRQCFWRRFLRLFSGLHSISEERRDSLQTGGEEKRKGDNYSDKLRTLPVLQDTQVILFSISWFDFIFITSVRMLFSGEPMPCWNWSYLIKVYHFLLFSHSPTIFPYLSYLRWNNAWLFTFARNVWSAIFCRTFTT